MRSRRAPRIDALVAATFGLLGVRLGARPISDNSAFTHLRTGIDMVRHGLVPAIPRHDPYSFTAFGHPWVVQSWLASFGMGWADRLGGHGAVIATAGLTMGALAWGVAGLARTGRPAATALAAFAALAVGVPFWTPRPLLIGLICLALTIWIVRVQKSPWLLVPLIWVWVNSHGSFPLGLAWIGATCVGAWLDRRGGEDSDVPWRYLGAFVVGLVVSMANPLGPRLLIFAASAFTKAQVFREVIEWRTVNFQHADGIVCLLGLVVAVTVLTRHRMPWRTLVPLIGFLGIGLYAQRNLAPLGVVLAPALAEALGRDGVSARRIELASLNRAFAGVLGLLAAAFLLAGVTGPPVAAADFPATSIAWLQGHGRFDNPHRLATRDTVGNYLELRRAPRNAVFIDDRVDMFPLSVSADYSAMLAGGDKGVHALGKWRIDTVLWTASSPFVDRLRASGHWRVAYRQRGWIVLFKRSTLRGK